MPDPFQIINSAVYDDKTLNEQAGIDFGTLKKARKSGAIRYATLGKRHVYLGFWILDWLNRISVDERLGQGEDEVPIQGVRSSETEWNGATPQGDSTCETDHGDASPQGEDCFETDQECAQAQGECCSETETGDASPPTPETELICEPDYDQGGFDGRRKDW